jgi:hypothetical protein
VAGIFSPADIPKNRANDLSQNSCFLHVEKDEGQFLLTTNNLEPSFDLPELKGLFFAEKRAIFSRKMED